MLRDMNSASDRWKATGFRLAFAAALLWPILYNGFPIVFPDTGNYLYAVHQGAMPLERSVYYSVFLTGVAEIASFLVVPFIQSLVVADVVTLFLRRYLGVISWPALTACAAALAAFTPLPWLASWLMPDVFGGIMILGLLALTAPAGHFSAWEKRRLFAAVVAAVLFHSGNLLLAALLVAVFGVARLLSQGHFQLRLLVPFSAVLLAGLFAVLPNALIYRAVTPNIASQAFLAARLIEDGFMQRHLDEECPARPTLLLCDHREELAGMDATKFLWQPTPTLATRSGAWRVNAAEYRSLIGDVVMHYWPEIASRAAKNTLALSLKTGLGGTGLDDNWDALSPRSLLYHVMQSHYPEEMERFLASRQQQGTLPEYALNQVHSASTWASYIALLALIGWAARSNRMDLVVLGLIVCAALMLNAGLHAALSGPYGRYHVRLTWLVMLAVFALGYGMSVQRRREQFAM
jgi:hypothetical protein